MQTNDERRFSEPEIAAIFKRAAEVQESTRNRLAVSDGLTLAELQEIGKEAGITPEFIARAAAGVERIRPSESRGRYLGLPIRVGRVVELPGPLSHEEWDRVVADLRETFQASGVVYTEGTARHWRNGNLHVHSEPTASGHRLRFRTTNSSLRNGLLGGGMSLALGLLLILMLVLNGDWMVVMDKTFVVSMFAVLGIGTMAVAALQLPNWAETREQQMEAVAVRAVGAMNDSVAASVEAAPLRRTLLDEIEVISDDLPAHRRTKSRA